MLKAFSPFQTSRTTDTLMVLEPGSRVRHTICASHNYTEPNSLEDEFRPVKLNQLLQAEDPSPSGGLRLELTKLAHRARPYLAPTAIGGLRPLLFAQTEAWASRCLNRTPCLPTRRGLGRSPIYHCIGALGLHWAQQPSWGPPSNPRRGTRGWGGVVDEEPAPERGNAA